MHWALAVQCCLMLPHILQKGAGSAGVWHPAACGPPAEGRPSGCGGRREAAGAASAPCLAGGQLALFETCGSQCECAGSQAVRIGGRGMGGLMQHAPCF